MIHILQLKVSSFQKRPYLVFSKMFSMLEFAQDIVDGQPLGKKIETSQITRNSIQFQMSEHYEKLKVIP